MKDEMGDKGEIPQYVMCPSRGHSFVRQWRMCLYGNRTVVLVLKECCQGWPEAPVESSVASMRPVPADLDQTAHLPMHM